MRLYLTLAGEEMRFTHECALLTPSCTTLQPIWQMFYGSKCLYRLAITIIIAVIIVIIIHQTRHRPNESKGCSLLLVLQLKKYGKVYVLLLYDFLMLYFRETGNQGQRESEREERERRKIRVGLDSNPVAHYRGVLFHAPCANWLSRQATQ